MIGDDLRILNIHNANLDCDDKIYILNIDYHLPEKKTKTDETIRYLWKWRYIAFDPMELQNTTIHFKHDNSSYLLDIFDNNKYSFYNIDSNSKSEEYDIMFDQIELHLDY